MERVCPGCGGPVGGSNPSKQFCSDACRKRVARGGGVDVPEPSDVDDSPLVRKTRAVLAEHDRLDTTDGLLAVTLAQQLGGKLVNTSGLASLSKEYRAVMAVALEGTETDVDPIDELVERREAKKRAAGSG